MSQGDQDLLAKLVRQAWERDDALAMRLFGSNGTAMLANGIELCGRSDGPCYCGCHRDRLLASKLEGTTQLFEDLLAGVRAFIRDRGRHDGPHYQAPASYPSGKVEYCAGCDLAYIEAEARLDECVRTAEAALDDRPEVKEGE